MHDLVTTEDHRIQPPKIEPIDFPRAGQLTSQAFSEMTAGIVASLRNMTERQVQAITEQRKVAMQQFDLLRLELENEFEALEKAVLLHRDRVREISEQIATNVQNSTAMMVDLSTRLRDFTATVGDAGTEFFK